MKIKYYTHFLYPAYFTNMLDSKDYVMALAGDKWYTVYRDGTTNYHYKMDYSEYVGNVWQEVELPESFATPSFP